MDFTLAPGQSFVFSVGGSLVVPNGGVDTQFLSRFNKLIRAHLSDGVFEKVLMVIGGGGPARTYSHAAQAVIHTLTHEDMDWLGIHATRLNAHLVRTIFHDIAHPRIIENYDTKAEDWSERVLVGAGWKPGWSTDYCACRMAIDYGAKIVINLSNIDQVYDKDPKRFSDAKPLSNVTWNELKKIVGDTWVPGLNTPFDPIATKLAAQHDLTVIVLNGNNFDNLEALLAGSSGVVGTIVHP